MIHINDAACIGCNRCANVCPGNLLWTDSKNKAFIKNNVDCWGCTACVKACPTNAIALYLSAQIGGNGGLLYATDSTDVLQWSLHEPDGRIITVTTQKKESNSY